MRRIGALVGVVTLVASGVYTLVYLYRWEWNRALFTGLLFVAVELALATAAVLARLGRLERRIGEPHPEVVERLRTDAPRRDHFAWLEQTVSRPNVFVTVLLGAGVLLSAGTWVVDRVASRTAKPTLERGLARRLAVIAFPADPLVPDDAELAAAGGPYGDDDLSIFLGPHP